jgi:hypothetical protein
MRAIDLCDVLSGAVVMGHVEHAALPQHDDPRRKVTEGGEVVAGGDEAAAGGQFATDRTAESMTPALIETVRELVEQNDPGLALKS